MFTLSSTNVLLGVTELKRWLLLQSYSNYSGSPRTPGTGTYSNSKAEAARSFQDFDPSPMGGQHSFGQHAMGQHYPGMHKHMNAHPPEGRSTPDERMSVKGNMVMLSFSCFG